MSVKHKICLLGAAGVGKTSLVSRFVRAVFFARYRTTVGVVIESKTIRRGGHDVALVVWDLSGEDEFQHVRTAYVRGASGYLLVVDGTRPATLEIARTLRANVLEVAGAVPCVVALNKLDLIESWAVDRRGIDALAASAVLETSAKTGAGVEEAFGALVDAILERDAGTSEARVGR